ncbi:NADPH-dependent F420 reductase [Chryseobacterium sp. HSC-36S06]|uniref:NADPH-dependent F420 reductase n=1 Tax=Chryseobacterium sp. HSC-36S06 TaxID=2910970 RepID=UPI00209D53DA|nr:NAD(P)-binding domain-containing protein [Chryseobacterium sp. HSC-36S06]MCP2039241.1 putative dinucleotide-binding enzyme [Chryseobacterium sp. HSC-36S06]
MKIGIIGVGHIGKTLAIKLAAAGHDVWVANSGSPENINTEVLATGAKAVTAEEAIQDKKVIILSIPLNRIPDIQPLFAAVPEHVTVIDTSNYYPARDQIIESIEDGLVESLWVQGQLGRPIAKAWNAIGSQSLEINGTPSGTAERIAIPFAADRESDSTITKQLIEDTGFDAFYSGSLEDSWRQQPGAPVYCTDLTLTEIESHINTAEREHLPARRDLAVAAIMERMNSATANPDADFALRLSRALYL